MREHPEEVLDGIRIMARALGVSKCLTAIENNKPDARAASSGANAEPVDF